MNIIEQVYAATVLWWAGLDKFPITSGTTAIVVATLRMRSTNGRVVWSEALLCGVFAMIATICLGFINTMLVMEIPLEASSGIGGAIGWYGTTRTLQFLESKVRKGDKYDSNRE